MTRQLIMLHGFGCGGEVWDPMRHEFQEAGWSCHARTLFPQRRVRRVPPDNLADLTLNDYIEAVSEQAATIAAEHDGEKPAVIGHSMGGLLAQILVERQLVSAAIFLAPAAPEGCTHLSLKAAFTFGNLISKRKAALERRSYKIWEKGFMWGVVHRLDKDAQVAAYKTARYESGRVFLDLTNPPAVQDSKCDVPTLTVAAGKDRVTVVQSVRKVAAKYGSARVAGEYKEYPEFGHWIVDEPGSETVTADLINWLDSKLPAYK